MIKIVVAKHNYLELFTWLFIIIATIATVFILPWYTAQNVLQYLLGLFCFSTIIWYIKSRQLYNETQIKNKKIIADQALLKEKGRTIDLIFNNSADGILILDSEQKIIDFSPGMENITGYKKDEVIGRKAQNVLKFKGDSENSLLPDMIYMPKNIKKSPYIKNSLITKDGREINIEASYTMVQDKKSGYKAMAIIRDVTFENELVQRDKEFIAITSHQMNTPLSIIKGYVSMLKSEKAGKISAKQKEYLSEIYSSVGKIISLTNNLLSISRIEQDKIKVTEQDINVADLLEEIKKNIDYKLLKKNVELNFPEIKKELIIPGDQEKLIQAISNLIDNSIKYTEKGNILIDIKQNKDHLEFVVSDTGIGISSDDLEKIGTKFYRAQNAIDVDNQGTGLGFFIAKTIIEKHNGKMEILSKKGNGTKIIINLPLNNEVNL